MRDLDHSKMCGIRAENYFASLMNRVGIEFKFVDDWYDFLVNNSSKVEVKSCELSVKEGKAEEDKYRPGRFDFTKEENREKQYKENIWVAFILRHEDNFILLGLTSAKRLKKNRYINLTSLRKLNLISFQHWLLHVNKRKNG